MSSLAVGIDTKVFVKTEATYDTFQNLAATDAISAVEVKFEPEKKLDPVKEHVGTGSLQGMIAGQEGGKWSLSAYVKPAAAGVAPDIGELLKAAYGQETISGGVSVTYALTDAAKNTLQIAAHVGSEYQVASGCWVEQLELECKGNEPPLFKFSGGFARLGLARGGTVGVAGAAGGASVVPVTAAYIYNYRIGAVVKIGTSLGTVGHRITDVNYTTNEITVTPVLDGAVTSGNAIVPYSPSMTVAGTILGGINCANTIDGTSVGFISAKLSLKTGTHGRDKEATAGRPTGVIKGPRALDYELMAYLLDLESGPFQGRAFDGSLTGAIITRVGPNTAAQRCKINVPKLHYMVTPIDIPEAEELTCTIKGQARQSAAAADEHTLVFD